MQGLRERIQADGERRLPFYSALPRSARAELVLGCSPQLRLACGHALGGTLPGNEAGIEVLDATQRLADQVIVIRGGSSDLSLATARLGAQRGASVVLAGAQRGGSPAGHQESTQRRGDAAYVVADVADEAAVQGVAQRAIAAFGRIDTRVNDAARSVYGRLEDISTEDLRRLMDVTFWGTVYGSRAAFPTYGSLAVP